jgi:hypothetical protein
LDDEDGPTAEQLQCWDSHWIYENLCDPSDAAGQAEWEEDWQWMAWENYHENCSHEEDVADRLEAEALALRDGPHDRPTPWDSPEVLKRLWFLIKFRRRDDHTIESLIPLAKAIRWRPGENPDTHRRFKHWARENPARPGEPADARIRLVVTALCLMKSSREMSATIPRDSVPQSIRLGERWVGGGRGRVVPHEALDVYEYVQWFRIQVIRIIRDEILVDVDHAFSRDVPLDFRERKKSDGKWFSPVAKRQVEQWQRASRDGDAQSYREEHQVQDGKASRDLGLLACDVIKAGVKCSKLERRILTLAKEDPCLQSYREVAERLGEKPGTVKNAIFRFRHKLTRALQQDKSRTVKRP